MAPSIQGPGSSASPVPFCPNCKDGSSDTGPAQSSISARRYNRRFCRCSWYQSKDIVLLSPDMTQTKTALAHCTSYNVLKFTSFTAITCASWHIIISHKRCINSRFRILYTYFRSSYCRLNGQTDTSNHYTTPTRTCTRRTCNT